MLCLLCLSSECDEHIIDIASAESQHQNIAAILHMHFRFCFHEEPVEGYVCQKCWVKVSVFHEFYTHIEYVHRANESIVVENFANDVKSNVDSDSDNWAFDFPPEKPMLRRGRPRKQDSIEWENETDNAAHPNDHVDTDFGINENTELADAVTAVVDQQKSCGQKKRGRPRKGDAVVRQEHNVCAICNIDFPTPTALYRHTKQKHVIAAFKCKSFKCVESYATQEELDTHLVSQHKKTPCQQCNKLILVTQLDQHMRVQHSRGDPVICDMCGKSFLNMFMYKTHYRASHEIQVVARVQCDICKQSYKNKAILARHLREHMHGPQICPTCGHVSPNRRALAKHKEIHIPELKDRYKCLVCSKGFRDKIKLKEHLHIHTGSAGTHHCNQCGKTFRFNSSFSLHKKTMHPKL